VTVPPDSPTAAALDCEAAIQRLVACHESGERPGDDSPLAAHLGSCLGCFRASADLKDVPRLAALLRRDLQQQSGDIDPGSAFWSSLPRQLGDQFGDQFGNQFDNRRTPVAAQPQPPVQTASAWHSFVRWIRMPVPAAMVGAACATAVALVMTRPPSLQTLGQRPVTAVAEDGAEAGSAGLLGQDDVSFAQSPSVYESVEELDTGALARVRDSFGSAVDQALTPHAQLSADDDDPGMGATSTAPNPATFSDDLEQLDVQGLQALRAELRGAQ
jgi:hypothetical protein